METLIHHHQNKNIEKDVENRIEVESSSSSSSSSPSHDFSFTISLHTSTPKFTDNSNKAPNSSLAIDLSPADDIFFHGHLLPLHLLSHFPSSSSPRSSINSLENFSLPMKIDHDEKNISFKESGYITLENNNNNNIGGTKVQGKSKNGFSLFGLTKGRKDKQEDKEKQKKKLRFEFDMKHSIKKCLSSIFFRGQREKNGSHRKKAYSYSGHVSNKQELRGWNGNYSSAPASMRGSPTNSGLLFATNTTLPPVSDSTMEELQAAIQAAIAHCKNSFAKEDNNLIC